MDAAIVGCISVKVLNIGCSTNLEIQSAFSFICDAVSDRVVILPQRNLFSCFYITSDCDYGKVNSSISPGKVPNGSLSTIPFSPWDPLYPPPQPHHNSALMHSVHYAYLVIELPEKLQ